MTFEPKHILSDGDKYAPSLSEVYYQLSKRFISEKGFYGLFADESICQGAIVGRAGGKVLTSVEDIPVELAYACLIGDGLFLAPRDYGKLELFSYVNHSCESNLARIGGLIFVAKTEIKEGEELTLDYAPLVSGLEDWEMECQCGSSNCRGLITGNDWQDPKLAKLLWQEWLPFIQQKGLF